MPFLDAFIKETLRLHPPTSFLLRGVQRPFEFAGYVIPAAWQVLLPMSYTHRMPEYFANPEQFDPARFLSPREEDKKTPYAWMGFGGGKHMCLGMGIAQIEMKTVLVRLLRQFDLHMVPGQNGLGFFGERSNHSCKGANLQREFVRRFVYWSNPMGVFLSSFC